MRIPYYTKRFRRDYAKLKKSGRRDMKKLDRILEVLIDDKILSPLQRDHALSGEWKKYRDCHIEGDWVLIYELGRDENGTETITFHATDTHSSLFE